MWKVAADSKKVKRLSKEEIKNRLLESLIISEVVEPEELNKEAEEIQQPEEAAKVSKKYEDVIRKKKKGIINIVYYQGNILKRFKVKEKFIKLVSQLGIHKNTIIFKINVFKLCERYSKLLRISIGLGFFKNYYKDIKTVSKENEEVLQ